MVGVFTSQGMGFRIPAGALSITFGDDGATSMEIDRVELSLDFWDHWLEIARDQALSAFNSHNAMIKSAVGGVGAEVGDHLNGILRAAMSCMGALGFSFDALYSSTKARLPGAMTDRAASVDSARYQHVHEILRRCARLSNEQAKIQRSIIKQIFEFRDRAVHPPGGWSEPLLHVDLDVGVDPAYVIFGARNAVKGYMASREIIRTVLGSPRSEYAEFALWAEGAAQRVPKVLSVDVAKALWPDNHADS